MTITDIKASLSIRKLSLPDHEIELILSTVEEINDCLISNYTETQSNKIKLYASLLIAMNTAMIYTRSQGSSSGASQSFAEIKNGIVTLYNTLINADKHGCTKSIVTPPDGAGGDFLMTVGR